ncbi:F0F1 ATP synthase subunit epsilon [Moraxella oblonga]|uniref:F0F1 ATP synthase subunit epsilon n=1 Tax=Moraxella oblonga TaxID=200413 RepID=UPI00082B1AAE|nr:F0F1 ATP synthase subunit epsilon [Moraxella oblonga]
MATFKCRVVSAREELYSGDIKVLVASGCDGELGILAGHMPLITLLKPGPMHLKTNQDTDEVIYVKGGVLEVQPHLVTVLADEAEHASNLDESKIAEARRHAEQALANQSANIDTSAALASLAETVAQLQTIRKFKNRA